MVREDAPVYSGAAREQLAEQELTAAWLLGRIPPVVIEPWQLISAGRAGRGAGPDVREAAFALPTGVVLAGDVEVHLRASDFVRHGHASDAAYRNVVLHLVFEDDRRDAGVPTALDGGGQARTVAVASLLGGSVAQLRALIALGPNGNTPCASGDPEGHLDALGREGQRRLAERTWRAGALAAQFGWIQAWQVLLERALVASAGRRRESDNERAVLLAAIGLALGPEPLAQLALLAQSRAPRVVIDALRAHVLGESRAAELGWDAVLPLLAALAAAYDDVDLARDVAALVTTWPAPRPYGRTLALSAALRVTPRRAMQTQGLLHTQDLWCSRAGCGQCPFSTGAAGESESRP
ncbi:MAG: DUF2851 family protein [Chloroflexi bacterium]|nr:MAG: DUF2851 family protein [Chloroflexota bacterium]